MLQLLVVEIGFQTLPGKGRTRPVVEVGVLRELCVYDIRILVPIINTNPHLHIKISKHFSSLISFDRAHQHTFLNVLSPAKILPPIHVEYLRSGGAKILIRISLTASRCTSCSNLSPKPFVSVLPPDSTILPKSAFRRSMSVRFIASTTIWWMPGYSRPIISGSKRISGARKRSAPICIWSA